MISENRTMCSDHIHYGDHLFTLGECAHYEKKWILIKRKNLEEKKINLTHAWRKDIAREDDKWIIFFVILDSCQEACCSSNRICVSRINIGNIIVVEKINAISSSSRNDTLGVNSSLSRNAISE